MNNFFEQELRRLFEDGEIIQAPKFVGRACLGELGGDLRVRAQFITGIIANQYNALKIVVLNRTDGPVDTLILKFDDFWGKKAVPGSPNFRSGVNPHIWDDKGDAQWYAYRPTAADYQTLRQAAGDYLAVFRERDQERERPAPVRKSSGRSASKKGREER